MIKKIPILLFVLIFALSAQAFAAEKSYHATGIYIAKSSEPLTDAKQHALTDAMRQAVEQSGVHVTSTTNESNNTISSDDVSILADNVVKVTNKVYDIKLLSDNSIQIRVDIDALIDSNDLVRKVMAARSRGKKIDSKYNEHKDRYYNDIDTGVDFGTLQSNIHNRVFDIAGKKDEKFNKTYRYNSKDSYMNYSYEKNKEFYMGVDDHPDEELALWRLYKAILSDNLDTAGGILNYWYDKTNKTREQEIFKDKCLVYILMQRDREGDCARAIKIINHLEKIGGSDVIGDKYSLKHPNLYTAREVMKGYVKHHWLQNVY